MKTYLVTSVYNLVHLLAPGICREGSKEQAIQNAKKIDSQSNGSGSVVIEITDSGKVGPDRFTFKQVF